MNTPDRKIRAEIAAHGEISFARFMELALYCPDCGFYEREKDTIGRRGDFHTSVSVGPLFGELLAFQFSEWFSECGTDRLQIVEAGAHDGRLARDILNWLKLRRPALLEKIEYVIIEPSAKRQKWQQETLKEFDTRVCWHAELSNLSSPLEGVIFANELLDAMPVHRVGWDAKKGGWFEWGVSLEGERFVWKRLSENSRFTFHVSRPSFQPPPELLAALPDGFTIDICPAAKDWWQHAASRLGRGKILTLDYGLEAEEFFAPHRADGTLRAYHRHHLTADVLANPGEQDLTAHVNFTVIRNAGEAASLKSELDETQSKFLTRIAGRAWEKGSDFGEWTAARTRQFQTLTHPEHMGRAFRVLVQTTGLSDCNS